MRIGLSGKISSGKSLVARYLVENYGFTELSFAARLKEIATDIFNVDPLKKDEKSRSTLQQLAHHMREIDPMVWVRYVMRQVPENGNAVISDVRYKNEYEVLRATGFVLARMIMDRPTQEKIVRQTYPGLPLELLDDKSETELDDYVFDYYIDNSSGVPLESVYKQADRMVQGGEPW